MIAFVLVLALRLATAITFGGVTDAGPPAVITALTEANVRAALESAGAKDIVTSSKDADNILIQYELSQIPSSVMIGGCEPGHRACTTMASFILFKRSRDYTLQLVNSFNTKYPAAPALVFEEAQEGNVVVIARLYYVDGGVGAENVVANFRTFALAPVRFMRHASPEPVASSAPSLDRRGASNLSATQSRAFYGVPTLSELRKYYDFDEMRRDR